MAENYEELAIDALADRLDDATYGLVAQLRALETVLSLTSGTIPDPVAIVREFVPADNRSPLVQIYDEASEPINIRNNLCAVDVTCAVTYNYSPDQLDSAAGILLRRYMRAIRMCVRSDYRLGSRVVQCVWTDQNRAHPMFDDSSTRQARALGFRIDIHDP